MSTCKVCDDIQEILVRRHPTGVRPLMCPACYGMLPKSDHAHVETYDDAIEACRLRGVEPVFLTHPLSDCDVDLRDVGPCFDGVQRATWEMLGAVDPDERETIAIADYEATPTGDAPPKPEGAP